ncbi:nucleotide sugar dehydrogenase [Qipengyuania atrilutea]|uniref:Nucleotide sugar dehydrogenase n=1 Tax=Qipengyuania atrilutea TaxID=2744473 RepID=A0A850H147_9SPHN|nr:nucleotide sugar dehydrogenase [Actirhodobacter atriluteus]NVD44406.1 nucleotide sugar dehydrogenase [Actirhodobacter atriluteus]
MTPPSNEKIVVVGLGYVGLPLAVALSRTGECWGLDIDQTRINELRSGYDRTDEVSAENLNAARLHLTSDPNDCPTANIYIVTVPTPVTGDNKPDLSAMIAATQSVATMIDPVLKPIIIFESTVYPGVTEHICGPEIERMTGLTSGVDFFLAYSPERINPGDREHTVDRITKVVSGQTDATLERVADLYLRVTTGGVHRAPSIQVAEAAKVIENAQRDINIAFMNEIAQIFGKLGLSVYDVLAAARTKWNFLPFTPGLVGGHCIGVDPYYLSHVARENGVDPKVILAGRSTNDQMANWVADAAIGKARAERILVLGLTFKENVPDLRNSKVADLVRALSNHGEVFVHDPLASTEEAFEEYEIQLHQGELTETYDLVVLAVPHTDYVEQNEKLLMLVGDKGRLFDLKAAVSHLRLELGERYASL